MCPYWDSVWDSLREPALGVEIPRVTQFKFKIKLPRGFLTLMENTNSKLSYKDALLSLNDLPELEPIIELPSEEISLEEVQEKPVVIPTTGLSQNKTRRRTIPRMRGNKRFEVKKFSFSEEERAQERTFTVFKRIEIEEVSDSDDDDDFVAPLADDFVVSELSRNQRKRHNRRLRREMARVKDEFDYIVMGTFAQEQGGFKLPCSTDVLRTNISSLKAMGLTNHEIGRVLRHKDLSERVLCDHFLRRAKREAIQIRVAKLRAIDEDFRERDFLRKLRDVERNKRRQHKFDAQRQNRYAELQGFGHAIALAASGLSAILLAKKASDAVDNTSNFIDTLKTKLTELSKSLSVYGDVVKNLLIILIVLKLYKMDIGAVAKKLLIGLVGVLIPKLVLTHLFDHFSQKFGLVEVQSGEFGLFPVVIATVAMFSFGVKNKPNLYNALVDTVSKIPRVTKGVDFLMEYGIKVIEAVVNVFTRWLNKPEFRFRGRLDAHVDTALKKAWALDRQINGTEFDAKTTPEIYSKCMDAFSELVKLIALYRENVPVRLELIQARNMMVGHCTSMRTALGRGAGFRQEPLSVLIESRPGKGKTMQIPALVGTLLRESGIMPNLTKDNLAQAFFQRPNNSDYFDGYFGQECYYIDDLFAIRPVPGKVSQYEEIMAFYGTVTCMLNMADCEKKGQYPFSSSLLLMTTNATDLNQCCASSILLEPDAFKRRFDIHVHLDVKPQYQIKGGKFHGQLNYDKFLSECARLKREGKVGRQAHPWYMWEVWDTTFGNPQDYTPGTGYCFSECVEEMIEGLRRKASNHLDNMDHLENVLPPLAPEVITEQQSGFDVKEAYGLDEPWFDTNTPCPSEVGTHFTSDDEGELLSLDDIQDLVAESNKSYHGFRAQLKRKAKAFLKTLGDAAGATAVHGFKLADYVAKKLSEAREFLGLPTLLIVMAGAAACLHFIKNYFDIKDVREQSNGPKVENKFFRPGANASDQAGPVKTIQDTIYSQSYKIVVDLGDDCVSPLGQMTFIAGSIAVMPNHFFHQLEKFTGDNGGCPRTKVEMIPCSGTSAKITTTVSGLMSYRRKVFEEYDLAFVDFAKSVRIFKNIVHFVLKESEHRSLGGRNVSLCVAKVTSDDNYLEKTFRTSYVSEAEVGRSMLRTNTRPYKRWLAYDAPTKKGDCGAPLMLLDYSQYNNRCWAGIHVAGQVSSGRGFATYITQEICDEVLKHFAHKVVPEATHTQSCWPATIEIQSVDVCPFTEDGTIGSALPLYEVSQGSSIPVKSSMVKTHIGETDMFHNEITVMNEGRVPPNLVPMKLGPHKVDGKTVYPMEEALKPFVGDVFVPDYGSFSIPLSAGLKRFSDATRHYEARPLTYEESILGVPTMGLKSVTRGTSVGYPICLQAKNKSFYFGDGDEFDLTNEESAVLFEDLERLDGLLHEGVRPQFVCKDFLKDETRKEGKVARLIAGTDLRYYLLCRKYFGAFVGAVRLSHVKSGMCLGMNPYSEFGVMKRFLLSVDPSGENVWDGDFVGFDSSQMPALLWECCNYINNWYSLRGSGEDNKIREILFMDLVSSRHLVSYYGVSTTVVEWSKSLPSGHFLTSTINSMLSMGLVASGFIEATGCVDFSRHCAAITLGDDNVVSTSSEFVDRFNQVTLAAHLKQRYGMEYTAGRKGEELRPTIGIDDVVFLQRRFAIKNGQDVCPIRPESFLHSLYYVKSKDAKKNKETILSGIELAFEELAMHSDEYWDLVAPKLAEAKRMYGETPNFPIETSADYFRLVRGRVPSYI